ncbi:hypothetical protein KUV51_07725 [Tateyamaria omphalii]|uniref:hypothetical protein n=1 Tax=Tateyamaria omphalii TaxID=299262 RepID=UPI001C999025|nr:hypothetical protein [Tateyamaria omphalii]MBY5932880.1 hypothetical protein [Tateyamaria omphalii]
MPNSLYGEKDKIIIVGNPNNGTVYFGLGSWRLSALQTETFNSENASVSGERTHPAAAQSHIFLGFPDKLVEIPSNTAATRSHSLV